MSPSGMLLVFMAFADLQQETRDPQSSKDLIPDKSLEAVIREGIFAKAGTKQPLTAEDLRSVSQIVAKGKGIRDLHGLERCSALATLDLSGNQITDLAPLAELKNLQGLFLAKNQVSVLKPLA